MAKGKKIPEIRFNVFSEEWVERKIREILIERNILAPKNEEYPLMAFVAYEGVTPKGDRFNREFLVTDEKNKKYKQTEFGDFIYSSNNLDTGSIGLNNYGKASISPVYSIFQPTEYGNSAFIGRLLVRKKIINEMIRSRQGVIYGQWRIHESDFIQITVNTPSVLEQYKIGTFFQRLDSLIALHQGKYDKIVAVKKSMLEKMFPKDGADIPEIRFKGFTGKWERKNLGDVCDSFEYGLNAAAIEYDGINKYLRITDIDEESHKFRIDDLTTPNINLRTSDNYRLTAGDLLFARTGASVGKSYIYSEEDGKVYFAGFLIRARAKKNINANFIFQNTLTKKYDQFVRIMSQRSGQPGINAQEYCLYNFMIPQRDEQDRIAAFFQNLDTLISLQHKELDKLKNIKKACLEKMFV